MSKHGERRNNAFAAGGRQFGREMLEDLMALTPEAAHGNLRRIYEARVALPKWARKFERERPATPDCGATGRVAE